MKHVATEEFTKFTENKPNLILKNKIGQIQSNLETEYYILEAGEPKIFQIYEKTIVDEERGNRRRVERGSTITLEDFNGIPTESLGSESSQKITENQKITL